MRGDEVYAVDDELHRCRASDGKKQRRFYTGGNVGTRMPPAVQGGTAWIAEPNDRGLIAASTRTGEEVFPCQSSGIGAYTMLGDGNRIFVAHAGSVVALPVRP
ncbi:hypothetical protein [Streptomyces sp. V1I1]|uniref:hypothetical protein n=1 Tax=Streptomyces sp. V1I1 TaxID=3042272 RepID=UPI0027853B5D|nr:hypothetical protein [Streptomyces sp. V1I1]MDQ0940337.1 hypothetical protein [Streptomyces sp. V1I1]